jgi:hypothetical protein
VEEIHLNHTRFLDTDNGRAWWPNKVLRDTPFINLSTSGELGLLAGRGSAGQGSAVGHDKAALVARAGQLWRAGASLASIVQLCSEAERCKPCLP